MMEDGAGCAAPELHSRVRSGHVAGEPQVRQVEVDGAAIRYRLWDQAGPDAPGLLFAHGFRAHARWWDHIAPAFAHRFRVAALDFSGFGDSDWRDAYFALTFARELLAVGEDAGLTPMTIVAHSFGGTPAAHAAFMAPEQVVRVVVIDSRMLIPALPEPASEMLRTISRQNQVFDSAEALLGRFRLLPPVDEVAPELLDHISRHSIRRVEEGWTWKFDARLDPQLNEDPGRFVPSNIQAPLNFIYGARSDVAPPETAWTVARYFGQGDPVFVAETNHHVPLERPAALIGLLRGMIGGA